MTPKELLTLQIPIKQTDGSVWLVSLGRLLDSAQPEGVLGDVAWVGDNYAENGHEPAYLTFTQELLNAIKE